MGDNREIPEGDPLFNPHEKTEVLAMADRLDNLRSEVERWQNGDLLDYQAENEQGPTSKSFIQMRLEHAEMVTNALDEAAAYMRAMVKVTELGNEWSNWWSAQ